MIERHIDSVGRVGSCSAVLQATETETGLGVPRQPVAQLKTIAKATYAKTLRKDDWPNQLA